jgi:hypothetical protein
MPQNSVAMRLFCEEQRKEQGTKYKRGDVEKKFEKKSRRSPGMIR